MADRIFNPDGAKVYVRKVGNSFEYKEVNSDVWRPLAVSSAISFNEITDNYTLQLSDAVNKMIVLTSDADKAITIPTDAAVAIPVGSVINVFHIGTGEVSFVASGGVTILSDSSFLRMATTNIAVTLIKHTATQWFLIGSLKE